MGSYPAACNCCASRCGGQPTVVSIGDDIRAPVQAFPNADLDAAVDKWEEDVPEWLATLAPGLKAEEAACAAREWARCAQDLRRRTRAFVRHAWAGVPCRLLEQATSRPVPASYKLDNDGVVFTVEELSTSSEASGRRHTCLLAEVRNIWVCADSALARRLHGAIHGNADADLACVVLMDAPAGPVGLVLRSSEAREDFLDCMAVLIAAQRLRSEPGLARCDLPGGLPPPEAQLRPSGKSLQSVHLSGPICSWLAKVGEELFAPDVDGEDSILHLPALGTPRAGAQPPAGARGGTGAVGAGRASLGGKPSPGFSEASPRSSGAFKLEQSELLNTQQVPPYTPL